MHRRKKKARCQAIQGCIQKGAPVKTMCGIAGIPRSSFYYFQKIKKRGDCDELHLERLKKTQEELHYTHGAKRMAVVLSKAFGTPYNHKRIERLMKKYELNARVRKHRFPEKYYHTRLEKVTALSGNVLNRQFHAQLPMKKLVTDITYLRVADGWLYLSAALDLFNSEIVSYCMATQFTLPFVFETVQKMHKTNSLEGTLIHSDQGWTYTNPQYVAMLKNLGVKQSFSRKGNCWDNACIESFFAVLKTETAFLYSKGFAPSGEQMKVEIERYIVFYNKDRVQKKLGYVSPVQYRRT